MSVPFLPVNPNLSTMKNQGRQKLACYGQKEFKNLVTKILFEIGRRSQPGVCVCVFFLNVIFGLNIFLNL